MELSIGEKIMVARMRKGLTRKALGHEVYTVNKVKKLDYPDGRIKKIETSVIPPEKITETELKVIAKVLNVPVAFFIDSADKQQADANVRDYVELVPEIFDICPDIEKYFDILRAASAVDKKMFAYNLKRMAEYIIEQVDLKIDRL